MESLAPPQKFHKSIQLGDVFLTYRLVKELGKGGFGSVYRGVKVDTSGINPEDHVAIKILHPSHSNQESLVRRFHREAKLAKKMSHPHVVRIFDDGISDGIHYIVMEMAEGKTLLQYLMEGDMEVSPFILPALPAGREDMENAATISISAPINLDKTLTFEGDATLALPVVERTKPKKAYTPQGAPVDLAVAVMKQCASVLQSAQTLGLLHRDLKPENILIRKDKRGQVQSKILDFGLAKNLVDESLLLSVEGQAVGTPAYMSPEQFRGETLDIRSDLYSLGATFYTFVTLTKPFPGPAVKNFMEQILNQAETPAHQVNRAVDLRFSSILNRLMQKNSGLRHQTPDELIEDLNRYSRGEKLLKNLLQKQNRFLLPLALLILFIFLASAGGALFWFWKHSASKSNPSKVPANTEASIPAVKTEPLVVPKEETPPTPKTEPAPAQEKLKSTSNPSLFLSLVTHAVARGLQQGRNQKKEAPEGEDTQTEQSIPLDSSRGSESQVNTGMTDEPGMRDEMRIKADSDPAPAPTEERTPESVPTQTTSPVTHSASSVEQMENTHPPIPPAPLDSATPSTSESEITAPPADLAPSPLPTDPLPQVTLPEVPETKPDVKKEEPAVVVGYTKDFTEGNIEKPLSERVQDILKRRSEN